MKKMITAVLASLVMFTGTAFAYEPADFFLNYGTPIDQGDMLVSVSTGMPWSSFDCINNGGWGAPGLLGKFEYAQPIGPVPFSFGGYLGLDWRGYPGYHTNYYYGDYYYNNGYVDDGVVRGHFGLRFGGLATYHVAIPQVYGLDLNTTLKMGMNFDISKAFSNGVRVGFDWGLSVGASYFFTEEIGITTELGYPYWTFGAIFKL